MCYIFLLLKFSTCATLFLRIYRSDKGGENVLVCDYMLAARESEAEPHFITGRSVHNQRVERMWRDLFQTSLLPFYNLFL